MTILAVEHPDWMLDAECTRVDPAIFYPEPAGRSVNDAKPVCGRCSVTAECLQFALDHDELNFGVWGGLSVTERQQLKPGPGRGRSAPRPIRHGTAGGYHTHRRRSETPCPECTDAATQAHRRRKERRRSA